MQSVAAGKLDQRINVVRVTRGPDATGQEVELSRESFGPHWAAMTPTTGREQDFVNRISEHLVYTATLRTPVDVKATDKVEWIDENKEFEIAEILKPTRAGFLNLILKRIE